MYKSSTTTVCFPYQYAVVETVAQQKACAVAGNAAGMIEQERPAGVVEVNAGEHEVGVLAGLKPGLG